MIRRNRHSADVRHRAATATLARVMMLLAMSALGSGFAGAQSSGYDFEFGDLPVLPPEQEIIGVDKAVSIDATSRDYILASVRDRGTRCLNFAERSTRAVDLIGKTLVLEAGHPNGLYERYMNGAQRDVAEMRLYAETIIVRSPLHLPGADVTIYARELRFEDGAGGGGRAQIITTPDLGGGGPVVDGCNRQAPNAGSLTLLIREFDGGGHAPRFVLDGGCGWVGTDEHQMDTYGTPGNGGAIAATLDVRHFVSQAGGAIAPGATRLRVTNDIALISQIPTDASDGRVQDGWYYPPSVPVDGQWGDFEFDGNGPDVLVHALISAVGNSVRARLFMHALETSYDWTCVMGECFWTAHSHHRPIRLIPEIPYCWWEYRDWDVHQDDFTFDDGSLVRHFWAYGDTEGDDVGIAHAGARVKLEFQPIQIVELFDEADLVAQRAGTAGGFTRIHQEYAWLHPHAVRMVLEHAKDTYYQGDLTLPEEVSLDYEAAIAALQGSDEWNARSTDDQADFEQLRAEMRTLLHRIGNNLDYYGNPPGWVPMLAFEIEHAAFVAAIEREFKVLYTAYWVTRSLTELEQRAAAFDRARETAAEEIESSKQGYSDTAGLLHELTAESQQISGEIARLEGELRALEDVLRQRAEDKFKQPWWRKALKGAGALLKVVPVYQPALGTIGSGLDLIGGFDADDPWATVNGLADMSGKFNAELFKQSAADWNNKVRAIDLRSVEDLDDLKQRVNVLRVAAKPIIDNLDTIRQVLRGTQAPRDKIEAELQRLKETDPAFSRVVDGIAKLMQQKETFAAHLANAMQTLTNLSNGITANLLTIDAINRSFDDALAALDPRVGVYVRAMEQRARDRLQQYHYYFRKAYEYRLLEPYPGEQDLLTVYDRFKSIVENVADPNVGLSADDFENLAAAYRDDLAVVTSDILDKYRNYQRAEYRSSVSFSLLPEELDLLNAGEPITVDLMADGLFFPNEEDLRVVDLEVSELVTHADGGVYGRNATLQLRARHSGVSRLMRGGRTYLFQHFNEWSSGNALAWGVKYDGLRNEITPIRPSPASESLIRTVTGTQDAENIMVFSRPAAWAELELTKETNTDNGVDIIIDDVVFTLTYDYLEAPEDKAILDVRPIAVGADAKLRPVMKLDTADLNARRDGLGAVRRSYTRGAQVSVTAPAAYGRWVFDGWAASDDALVAGGAGALANRTISLVLDKNASVYAYYVRADEEPSNADDANDRLDSDSDGDPETTEEAPAGDETGPRDDQNAREDVDGGGDRPTPETDSPQGSGVARPVSFGLCPMVALLSIVGLCLAMIRSR